MKIFADQIRPTIAFVLLWTIIFGLAYPGVSTVLVQALFPKQSEGSLIIDKDGKTVLGSELIGQPFSKPAYFWSRLSATSPFAYNAASSSGSNLGSANPALTDNVKARITALKAADAGNTKPIPVDLVTASASGLDPQISPAAAEYQVGRVAKARNLPEAKIREMVAKYTDDRGFGVLGEAGVNVLKLNLALDGKL